MPRVFKGYYLVNNAVMVHDAGRYWIELSLGRSGAHGSDLDCPLKISFRSDEIGDASSLCDNHSTVEILYCEYPARERQGFYASRDAYQITMLRDVKTNLGLHGKVVSVEHQTLREAADPRKRTNSSER